MKDAFTDFMSRQMDATRYTLSEDERRLLGMYRLMSDIQKGEVLGTVKSIITRKEQDVSN